MDVTGAITQIEASIAHQLALPGGDPEVTDLANSLLNALQPALRQAAFELAQQAAAEVAAQLPGHDVRVTLADGEPMVEVRQPEATVSTDDYEARLTLRLPDALKRIIEESAGETGDSVNSWVVKTLSTKASTGRQSGTRVKTRIEL
ncbi:MAG: type II toxin-antitoxin system HicB family antitoxin [Acidimicrobiia bacterium]|nr:type II toxin-antitoxin system HicB family antitoxin [Acidimicrobiia bacterium]